MEKVGSSSLPGSTIIVEESMAIFKQLFGLLRLILFNRNESPSTKNTGSGNVANIAGDNNRVIQGGGKETPAIFSVGKTATGFRCSGGEIKTSGTVQETSGPDSQVIGTEIEEA